MTVSKALSFWLILVGNLGGLQPQLSNHAANLGCDIWWHLWSLCFFCTNFAFTAAPHGCLNFPFSHFHLHSCWHFFQWWYEIVPCIVLVTFCMIFTDSNDTLASDTLVLVNWYWSEELELSKFMISSANSLQASGRQHQGITHYGAPKLMCPSDPLGAWPQLHLHSIVTSFLRCR